MLERFGSDPDQLLRTQHRAIRGTTHIHHDGKIQLTRIDHRAQVETHTDADIKLYVRKTAAKLRQQVLKVNAQKTIGQSEAHDTAHLFSTKTAIQLVQRREHLMRACQEHLAFIGKHGHARRACHQGASDELLKFSDLMADCRLGKVEPGGRKAEPTSLLHRH